MAPPQPEVEMTASQKLLKNFAASKFDFRCSFFMVLLFALFTCSLSQSIVETLPGYAGSLPFKLETGYIGVGENEELQLFYYFIESERDPAKDPVLIWLVGGPGCSSFSGLVFEIGPVQFDFKTFNASLPTLISNPYSWTKVVSIIFVDSPVGTGYSYSNTYDGYHSTDHKASADVHIFLRKWLQKHPSFLNNPLYVGGDSYGGKFTALVTWKISEGIEAGVEPRVNLHGYIVGNPVADKVIDGNAQLPFAHRMGLIADEYYKMAETHCQGNYISVDPSNGLCLRAIQHYQESTAKLCFDNILEPVCEERLTNFDNLGSNLNIPEDTSTSCTAKICFANVLEPECEERLTDFGSNLNISEDTSTSIIQLPSQEQEQWCRKNEYFRSHIWANDATVQEALHVRKGTFKEWRRCNYSLSYSEKLDSVLEYHQLLSKKGYKTLAYNGDHDLHIPYTATLEWVHKLNLPVAEEWRPWTVDDQVAGYTKRFLHEETQKYVTFATVKAAGHTAPEYKPKECLAMVARFFSDSPL